MSLKSHIITTLCGVKVNIVVEQAPSGEAFALYETLTQCCEAAVTGTIDGLVCKDCCERVDEDLVGGGVQSYINAARSKACPDPVGCGYHTQWHVELMAQQLVESFEA